MEHLLVKILSHVNVRIFAPDVKWDRTGCIQTSITHSLQNNRGRKIDWILKFGLRRKTYLRLAPFETGCHLSWKGGMFWSRQASVIFQSGASAHGIAALWCAGKPTLAWVTWRDLETKELSGQLCHQRGVHLDILGLCWLCILEGTALHVHTKMSSWLKGTKCTKGTEGKDET